MSCALPRNHPYMTYNDLLEFLMTLKESQLDQKFLVWTDCGRLIPIKGSIIRNNELIFTNE